MPEWDQESFLLDMLTRAKTIYKNAERIGSLARGVERSCMTEQADRHNGLTYTAELLDDIERNYLDIVWLSSDLFKAVSEPNLRQGEFTRSEALLTEEQAKFHTVFSVEVEVKNACVLVKTPPLPSRYHASSERTKGYRRAGYAAWFTTELEAAFAKKSGQLPTFSKVHMTYLYVIAPDKKTFPDNDNRDTKRMTDTVCDALCLSDNALFCSFSAFGSRTANLEEGTYLCVSGDYDTPPTLTQVQALFESVWGKERPS